MSLKEIDNIIINLRLEWIPIVKEGKRCFLFVYCAGHGLADQRQYMVFNGTSGNLYRMEAQLRDIANLEGKKAVTVFGIYDMCKDVVSRYEDLTLKIKRPPK